MEFFKKTTEIADNLFEMVGWAIKRVESNGPANCKSARGAIAEVSVAIPQGGTGEIVVEVGKALHHYPAKAVTGQLAFKRGTRVKVIDVGQNMMHVDTLEEFGTEKLQCCAHEAAPAASTPAPTNPTTPTAPEQTESTRKKAKR